MFSLKPFLHLLEQQERNRNALFYCVRIVGHIYYDPVSPKTHRSVKHSMKLFWGRIYLRAENAMHCYLFVLPAHFFGNLEWNKMLALPESSLSVSTTKSQSFIHTAFPVNQLDKITVLQRIAFRGIWICSIITKAGRPFWRLSASMFGFHFVLLE